MVMSVPIITCSKSTCSSACSTRRARRSRAPFKLSSLWASAGLTDACALTDDGDPIVLYDPLADRWLLSQFALPTFPNPPFFECIAISKTSDPTGAYFVYTFNTPGNEMPDYPKIGVWPDAYYMTTNQFTNGGPFNGAGFFAFERAKMLAGDPSAALLYTSMTEGCPACADRRRPSRPISMA